MPSKTTTPETYASLVAHFTSLLTVTIHTLLSARDLYPAATFLTARAYNIPVRQSRHPGVCSWISAAVDAIRAQLLKCTVAKIVFVIFEAEGKGRVLERWVWDVSRWPVVPGAELETRLARERQDGEDVAPVAAGGKNNATSKHIVDMEEQFRGLLARLTHIPARLRPLPAECSYTMCIELREPDTLPNASVLETAEAQPPIGHPQPWIPAQPSMQKTVLERGNERYGGDIKRQVQTGADVGGRRTVPVRTVEAGEMRFEMWVEEGAAKFTPVQESRSSGSGSGLANENTTEASSSGFGLSSGSSGGQGRSSPLG